MPRASQDKCHSVSRGEWEEGEEEGEGKGWEDGRGPVGGMQPGGGGATEINESL